MENKKIIKGICHEILLKKFQIEEGDINQELEKVLETIETFARLKQLDTLSRIYPDIINYNLKEGIQEEDKELIVKELEMSFNVKLNIGITLVEEDPSRDKTWWSNKEKLNNELYYWKRYQKYIKGQLPEAIVNVLDEDTDVVLNNIGKPSESRFARLGMVVGHVQSGKTSNYTGLICKAADAGYKFIVVIAGGMNNLRNQTQTRINEGFIGKTGDRVVGVGIGNFDNGKLPISLTSDIDDFKKTYANQISQGFNFENTSVPVIMVIKKNTGVLKNVINWIKSQYKNEIDAPFLIIDDESDYASINTKTADDPTSINKAIRQLLVLFKKSSYVAYTATPYANILINHKSEDEELGIDLFPKNFIHCLDAPSNYFGASKIFKQNGNEQREHIIEIDDNELYLPLKHKKDYEIAELPESLKEAIRLFLLNIGIRCQRGDEDKHNSMLIHVSRFTAIHQGIKQKVTIYFNKLKSSLESYGMLRNGFLQDENIAMLKKTFEKYYIKKIAEDYESTIKKIAEKVDQILIREAHQATKIPLEYRDDVPTYAIVIGGASLSRGYTLEGLNISYFLRTTMYYDTLMQMGRWFGYRINYEDLCKVYMTAEMADNFEHIIIATEELMSNLSKMSEEGKTPKEFGLAIQLHPESALQITARNKQKNSTTIIMDMSLSNTLKQTTWLVSSPKDIKNNYDIIDKLLTELSGKKKEHIKNNYLYRDINKEYIVDFLKKFKVYSKDKYGFTSHLPLPFMIKQAEEMDESYDLGFISGSGDLIENERLNGIRCIKRTFMKVDSDDFYRIKMLSGPINETLPLSQLSIDSLKKDDKLNDRTEIRKHLERPLLLIYYVENKENNNIKFPAYAVIYPNNGNVVSRKVSVRINTVFMENILEDEAELYEE